jgi:hypothetical protein
MKKCFLLLLLLPAMAAAQTQSNKSKEPCNNYSAGPKDKVVINNILPAGYNSADSLLQKSLIKHLQQKESPWKFFEWLLPLVISSIALWFSIKAFGRDRSYQNAAFLSEVDKLLIEHPYLRGIYNSHYPKFTPGTGMLEKVTQEEYDGKLYAYCYYLINNFEVIFKYSKKGSSNRVSWENYLIHLMKESDRFKEKVKDASTNSIFDITYQEELKKLIAVA